MPAEWRTRKRAAQHPTSPSRRPRWIRIKPTQAMTTQRIRFTRGSAQYGLLQPRVSSRIASRLCAVNRPGQTVVVSRASDRAKPAGMVFNAHFIADGAIVYRQACALGCEGIVSKRLGSPYRSGRADCWLKVKNPAAPARRVAGPIRTALCSQPRMPRLFCLLPETAPPGGRGNAVRASRLDYDDGTVRRPLSFASAESSGSWYAIMLANLPSAPIR